MRVGAQHLTYCTNIHPGESWAEVHAMLRTTVPAVKAELGRAGAFGVGLRLSAAAARELRAPEASERLVEALATHDLYVVTLNGFPYGRFHGAPVKAEVYRPDWRDVERERYTDDLAAALAAVLPEGERGSISTVPGGFRVPEGDVAAMAAKLLQQAARLWRLAEDSGKHIALALEPEPECFLETTSDAVAFFEAHLLSQSGLRVFRDATSLAGAEAEAALRRHLGVCLDACHAAVEFESGAAALGALRRAGICVPKIQLSSGLRIPEMTPAAAQALRAFAEDTYLHQVVERRGDQLVRWLDLPEALEAWDGAPSEWRVHFHVPIFVDELAAFSTTSSFLADLLQEDLRDAHLEVETYTFDVLPPDLQADGVVPAICRELRWAREQLER